MEELYDEICKVLTWYEHPEEYPFDEKEMIAEDMYKVLCKVQNKLNEQNEL